MRMTTEVWIAIRQVGAKDSAANLQIMHGPLKDCIFFMIQWIKNTDLLQRFDICMGRNREECVNRLLAIMRTPQNPTTTSAQDELMELLNNALNTDDF